MAAASVPTASARTAGPPGSGVTPDDAVLVVFGANGDLAKRKILPALYHLWRAGMMPGRWRVIGNARSEVSTEAFRESAREAIGEEARCAVDDETWRAFADRLSFSSGRFSEDDPEVLTEPVAAAERAIVDEGGTQGRVRRLFYLSTPPSTFGPITLALGKTGLAERARVVYEKPFGLDHEAFRELDELVRDVLDEEQVYRIDHFLGKEAVQNILALRFANGMFEAMWNRAHVDHVQIDVPEDLTIGTRAAFYEKTGALRDMLVTHLFQVMSVVAMEPPSRLTQGPLIDEKVKVFESMRDLVVDDVVLGQYEGYRDADGVADDSRTDTFVAARVFVDNWRWDGVPFYLRTGKAMAEKRQTVTLAFRSPPATMFDGKARAADGIADGLLRNHLSFELGGDPSVTMHFLAKQPGPGIDVGPARMRFSYEDSFGGGLIEAYERLILDTLVGDRTLFTRADGIGRTWEAVARVLDDPPPVHPYPRGSWGPEAATDLIAPRRWHLPGREG